MRGRARSVTVLLGLLVALGGCGGGGTRAPSTGSATASTGSATASTTGSPVSTTRPARADPATPSFEGVPIERGTPIAAATTTGARTVDGIPCGSTEQLAYHIHARLSVYVNRALRPLPGGVGIPGSRVVEDPQAGPVAAGGRCIYWLHTHAPDGVIHIESPTRRIYTLGNLFDVWHQPLGADRVGAATGPLTALVNGRRWRADPRSVPLTPHAVIQLNVGPAVAFRPVDWTATQL